MVLMVFLEDQKGTNKHSRHGLSSAIITFLCSITCQGVNFKEAFNLGKSDRNSLKSR